MAGRWARATWPRSPRGSARRCGGAGLPVGPGRCERFAGAVDRGPAGRPCDELYLCALATLVSGRDHSRHPARPSSTQVFGGLRRPGRARAATRSTRRRRRCGRRATPSRTCWPGRPGRRKSHVSDDRAGRDAGRAASDGADAPEPEREIEHRYLGSTVERLAGKDFADLSESELLLLAGLMRSITLAGPAAPVPPASAAGPEGRAPTCDRPCGRPGAPAATRSGSCPGRRRGDRAGWSCCATSPGRWNRTRGP